MIRYAYGSTVLVLLFFLTGCNLFNASKMSESKFVDYYIDFVIQQDSLGKDFATTHKIQESLNKKYKVSQKEFDETLKYYSAEAPRWETFFTKVLAEVKKRQTAELKKL